MGKDDEPPPENVERDPGQSPGPEPAEDDNTSRSRVLKFARRLMDRKELAEDTMTVLSAVWSTSDKAKTEAVRLMAREFRSYLKELKLKEDLLKLMTSHSLEVSIHLKPLAPESTPEPQDPARPTRGGK